MEITDQTYRKFENNLKLVDQINEIGLDVSKILSSSLKDLVKKNEEVSGCQQIKRNLEYTITLVDDIKNHSSLREKYAIIYNQSVVLVVANFESFMHGLIKEIVDNCPDKIVWPEKGSRVSFDPELLTYTFPTVGEIVVRSLREKYSFQDLQSTLRFLREYFGIDLMINDELRDKIILYHAYRNTIMHDFSQKDAQFKKQIRNINVKPEIREEGQVKLNEIDYVDAKKSFMTFAKLIVKNIDAKLEEK